MIIIRPQNYVFFLSFPSRKHFLYYPPLSFCRLGPRMPQISRIFTVPGRRPSLPRSPLLPPSAVIPASHPTPPSSQPHTSHPPSSRPHILPRRHPGLRAGIQHPDTCVFSGSRIKCGMTKIRYLLVGLSGIPLAKSQETEANQQIPKMYHR